MCRVLFAVGSGISNLALGLGQRRHWILQPPHGEDLGS